MTDHTPDKASPPTGTIDIIPDFAMSRSEATRRIWVYRPPGYDDGNDSYPVLYMQDGQNLFDEDTSFVGEWGIDETLDSLVATGRSNGGLVVGIDNSERRRMDEYGPWTDSRSGRGGYSDRYLEFLVTELKPWVDLNYRTRSDRVSTGIGGSSMGGLLSLYAGFRHPETFGRIAAFSPSFWFAERRIFDFVKRQGRRETARIYLDIGGRESDSLRVSRREVTLAVDMFYLLQEKGFLEDEVRLVLDSAGRHHESHWGERFAEAFMWLFGSESSSDPSSPRDTLEFRSEIDVHDDSTRDTPGSGN